LGEKQSRSGGGPHWTSCATPMAGTWPRFVPIGVEEGVVSDVWIPDKRRMMVCEVDSHLIRDEKGILVLAPGGAFRSKAFEKSIVILAVRIGRLC